MRVTPLCLTLLLCVLTVTSAAVKRRRTENESSLPLIWDVIGLLSRFLDLSDLFPFSQVCRMFEDVATHSLTLRTGGLLRNNQCGNQVIICENNLDVYQKSQWYSAIHQRRTVLRFGDEHLLIRGVGLSAESGYTGRMVVQQRVKVPISDEFKMTPDKDWIWVNEGWMMNLHNQKTIQLSQKIFDFVPPYFVQINEEKQPLLYRLDAQTMGITLISHCQGIEIDDPYKDLYLLQSSPDRLPSMVILENQDTDPGCGLLDFNDEKEDYFRWPDPFDDEESTYQISDSKPRTIIVQSSEYSAFMVINRASKRTLVRSLVPFKGALLGECWYSCENCVDNGRYALISFAERILRKGWVHRPSQIFDLQTGEMIGPETTGIAWVSEELFYVPGFEEFVIGSVHQPREMVACVMVDEGGNETPMMDSDFKIINKNDVLFDVRSNEILFVEWERD